MSHTIELLGALSGRPPIGTADYNRWLEQSDFLEFLQQTTTSGSFERRDQAFSTGRRRRRVMRQLEERQ
jgi:hypothetical protein